MTTIAYKDKVIAFDSRITCNDTIDDDSFNKHFRRNGFHFFLGGDTCDYEFVIDCFFSGEKLPEGSNAGGYLWDGERLRTLSIRKGKVISSPHSLTNASACGSGADHAITAMDMGATARHAVLMASKRDICTGGKIRTFRLK